MNKPVQSPWIFNVDFEDFTAKVIERSQSSPILVDLWADWCSPCRVIAPVLERIVNEYDGKLLLAKVEVDEGENMKLAGHYQARGFPTVMLFESGEVIGRFSGAKPVHFIREFIADHSQFLQEIDKA